MSLDLHLFVEDTSDDDYPEEHAAADLRDAWREAHVDELLDNLDALSTTRGEGERWCPVCSGPLAPDEEECARCWGAADDVYRRRVDV